jgi:peptidoglycan/xylan/chitin deacetylase (PgdA/CDA1 family)
MSGPRSLRRAVGAAARAMSRPDVATRRVVLCYHSVHPSSPHASATPREFAEQLEWLATNCEVVDLSQVGAANRAGRPRVALTFDDGYADNHEFALPSLAAHGFPATFFVTAGFLERDSGVLAHLSDIWDTPREELSPLSWSQVAEMRATGMAVGSHTFSHSNLAALAPGAVTEELRRSKDVIESNMGERVDAIAYPFGKLRQHVSNTTCWLARKAGYRHGYVVLPRAVSDRDGALRIPRFAIGRETMSSFAGKVRGDIDWHATVHTHLPRRLSSTIAGRPA